MEVANYKEYMDTVYEAINRALTDAGFSWSDDESITAIFESAEYAFVIPQYIWNLYGLSTVCKPDKVIINYNSKISGVVSSVEELRELLGGDDKLLRDNVGQDLVHYSTPYGPICAAEEGENTLDILKVSCKYCHLEIAGTSAKLVGVVN